MLWMAGRMSNCCSGVRRWTATWRVAQGMMWMNSLAEDGESAVDL